MLGRIGRLFQWLYRNRRVVVCLVGLVICIWMWESGMMQETMQAQYGEESPPPLPSPVDVVQRMPNEQLFWFASMAAVWMLGVPALIAVQGRRAGRPWRQCFLASPFYRDFDLGAWVAFAALVIVSLRLGAAAIDAAPPG